MCRAVRPVVTINIPFDSGASEYSFTIDRFALRQLETLPPAPDTTTDAWWTEYGGLYRELFVNYGTQGKAAYCGILFSLVMMHHNCTIVVSRGSLGGMVELYSTFVDPESKITIDTLTTNALNGLCIPVFDLFMLFGSEREVV